MSKTEENLQSAFAGERMARNKYTYFEKVAAKEGYHYIAKIFEETAANELQHAKNEFKLLGFHLRYIVFLNLLSKDFVWQSFPEPNWPFIGIFHNRLNFFGQFIDQFTQIIFRDFIVIFEELKLDTSLV